MEGDEQGARGQGSGDGAGLSSPSKGWGYRSGYIKYPDSREPSSSSSRRGRVRGVDEGSAAGAAAADFVVIGKGGAGSYMQTVADLEDKEGGSFWEAAIMDEEGDEDEEYEEFEEGEDQGDDEDEVGVEGAGKGRAVPSAVHVMDRAGLPLTPLLSTALYFCCVSDTYPPPWLAGSPTGVCPFVR